MVKLTTIQKINPQVYNINQILQKKKPTKTMKEKEYDFTLRFDLEDPELDPAIYVELLYESGCDDALIGIGQKGYIVLSFIREALSSSQAITKAIADVKKVIPFATLVETTLDMTETNPAPAAISVEAAAPPPNIESLMELMELANVGEKAKGTARV